MLNRNSYVECECHMLNSHIQHMIINSKHFPNTYCKPGAITRILYILTHVFITTLEGSYYYYSHHTFRETKT